MALTPDVLNLSLREAARKVRDGSVSPVELVEASLARIAALDGSLHAFISVFADQATAVAKAMEAMARAGHILGPLHGVPLALKDNIAVQGFATTAGSKILADAISSEDATVAQRLRQAGAIFVGKLNMHEFAWGGTSANPHYGTVANPWNTSRFAGGSSGGSGAALAARMCYGTLGTDTGGSIRLPSAINGVVGIRPTYGRVSNHGIIPLAWSMDTAGPLARDAADCALMFQVIAGHDPRDPASDACAVSDYTALRDDILSGLRIGVIPGYFDAHLQKPVHDAVSRALAQFVNLGAQLVEVSIPNIQANISAQLTIEASEPSTYHQQWLRERPQDYGEDVRTLLEVGELLPATHYLQAQRYRSTLRRDFLAAFNKVDVFICPTLPFTATPLGATEVVIEHDTPEDMLGAIMRFTGIPSLTGLPALSLPCGFDGDGMPIGMQLIGKPFGEQALFNIGTAYQAVTDFHTQSPRL
ncbi:MAG: aspartyl/glutamyl-tRNA amidotransferase subunit A [Gammaproteobacteria bacterium]|nr:aspartyl/glutamyl-tRNA amidotransferase subunit A [Gammaproteobacteria bacterium]